MRGVAQVSAPRKEQPPGLRTALEVAHVEHAGVALLDLGEAFGGEAYDVVVHATFLGFTISMVTAHGPVILPAVLRRPLPCRGVLWEPRVLLHASLALRLWVGDALDVSKAWQVGGALNVVALLLFFGLSAGLVLAGARPRERRTLPERAA